MFDIFFRGGWCYQTQTLGIIWFKWFKIWYAIDVCWLCFVVATGQWPEHCSDLSTAPLVKCSLTVIFSVIYLDWYFRLDHIPIAPWEVGFGCFGEIFKLTKGQLVLILAMLWAVYSRRSLGVVKGWVGRGPVTRRCSQDVFHWQLIALVLLTKASFEGWPDWSLRTCWIYFFTSFLGLNFFDQFFFIHFLDHAEANKFLNIFAFFLRA